MSAKNGDFLRQHTLLTTTASVTVGSEPDLYTAVTLAGAPSINSRGVVVNSRDGFVTICTLGQVPVKVADGATITKGAPVSINANGEIIAQLAARDTLGFALEGVTSASGDYIELFVNPRAYVAAT